MSCSRPSLPDNPHLGHLRYPHLPGSTAFSVWNARSARPPYSRPSRPRSDTPTALHWSATVYRFKSPADSDSLAPLSLHIRPAYPPAPAPPPLDCIRLSFRPHPPPPPTISACGRESRHTRAPCFAGNPVLAIQLDLLSRLRWFADSLPNPGALETPPP